MERTEKCKYSVNIYDSTGIVFSRSECYATHEGTMSSTSYVLYPMTDEVSDTLSKLTTNTTFCANGRIENNVINLLETRRFYILSISDE